jgi:Tfp pilus assembly protein PilF
MELAYYLSLCHTKLEHFEEAILFLDQVIISGSDMMRVYQCRLTLAYIYIKTDRARMAEFELRRLLKSGFESAALYNTLAYAAYVQKRYRNAVELYEKALELDSTNATALNSMGFILADTGTDKMKGLQLCLQAVEQNPKNPAYLDSLGWAYYKNGEMREARSFLSRAKELAPKEHDILKHYRVVTGEGT